MIAFHFYTEIDLINSQSAGEEFGPAGVVSGAEKFRVTDLHSSNGTPNAYAICDGTVCIQQDSGNSNLINLILKPKQQPEHNFPEVRFFVYKGILKSSLVSNGEIIVDSNNDLVTSIKNSQDALNAAIDEQLTNPPGTTTDPASENSLGIYLDSNTTNFGDQDPIDNLFYQDQVTFQLPEVKGGWLIGHFNPSSFGMEIILNEYGYDPKLEIARVVEHLISVDQLGSNPTNTDQFKFDHDKEEVLNYVDPAAFFGSFYSEKLLAKSSASAFTAWSGNDIYDEILKGQTHSGSSGNFLNRDRVYLDIRNENGYSFDYYKNYGRDISVAFEDDSSLLAVTSYYQAGWPLYSFDSSNLPTGNASSKNVILLSLPHGDNSFPLVYVAAGYTDRLAGTFRAMKGQKRFISLKNLGSTDFFDFLKLAFPNNSNSSATQLISNYCRLVFIKKFEYRDVQTQPTLASPTSLPKSHYLDNVFSIDYRQNIAGSVPVKFRIYGESRFLSVIEEDSLEFFASIGVAEDSNNVTFFSFAENVNKRTGSKISKRIALTSGSVSQFNSFGEFLSLKFSDARIVEGDLVVNQQSIEYLRSLNSNRESLTGLFVPDPNELVVLSIGNASFASFTNLIASSSIETSYRIYLAFSNKTLDVDARGQEYYKFDIVLRGFTDNAGSLEVIDVPTNINFYQYAVFPNS